MRHEGLGTDTLLGEAGIFLLVLRTWSTSMGLGHSAI